MKTLLTVLLVTVVGLFGLSLVSAVAALFVPTLHVTHVVGEGLVQPWGYNGMMLGGQMEQHLWLIIFFIMAAVTAVIYLRRRSPSEQYGGRQRSNDTPNGELDALAHDLDRTARRLEERLEALETILLERSSHRR